jgi:hypothetical protein
MDKHWMISRRTVLRGLGVAMALPLLESMGWAETPKAGKAAMRPPVRTAFFMVPNGVVYENWKFKKDAPGAIPRILAPLAPVMSDVLVINNLRHDKAGGNGDGAGDHARETGTFLTGAQCRKTAGTDIQAGISIDQAMADRIGIYTSLPSLELGIEQGGQAGNCDSGYSCAYSSNISWRTPNTPMAKEINPKAAFDRMFSAKKNVKPKKQGGPTVDASKFGSAGQTDEKTLDQSVLDLVLADAKRLRGNVGGTDQRKLDEYLDSVRAMEKRIEHAQKEAAEAAEVAAAKKPGTYSPLIEVAVPADRPQGFPEHVKLMMDLMILAFQTDTTRIATFMFGNGGSNRTYPHVGVSRAHHEISHHQKDASKLEDLTKINTHHIELLSYMLQRMKSLNDGKGTLLDNSMILYGSAIGDGDRHNHDDLPVLLAGRGGGTINSGRVIDTRSNMCDLFLAMAARAGCQLESHGDSTKMMEGL